MLGLSAWKAGDRETAVNAFTLALEKDSTHVKSHLNLSRVLIEQGHAQEALPHVAAALAIDSTSSEGFRLRGRVKSELSDSDGAIAAYKRAIVLDGRDAWSLNNLARVYMGQGRPEGARPPDDAVQPLEESQGRVPREREQRQGEQRRGEALPSPDRRGHRAPSDRKEQHRCEHLHARERVLRSFRDARRDEAHGTVRRVV